LSDAIFIIFPLIAAVNLEHL